MLVGLWEFPHVSSQPRWVSPPEISENLVFEMSNDVSPKPTFFGDSGLPVEYNDNLLGRVVRHTDYQLTGATRACDRPPLIVASSTAR